MKYIDRVMKALKKGGDGLYLGGAAASLAAGIPFAQKYAHVFAGLPWKELTSYVKYPWEVIGIGELGQVISAYDRDKADKIKPHWLEHAGRFMRPANLASIPIASATDDNALFALALTGGLTVVGHGLEYIGSVMRKKHK